jgi:RND family efflux transporter MFP subunit
MKLNKLKKIKINPLNWSKKIKIIASIIIVAAGIGGYFWHRQRTQASEMTFTTSQAEEMNLVKSLTLSGTVQQSNVISVYTKASGLVKEIYVTDGQVVKAGDKLAEITLDSEGKNNQAQAWSSYQAAKNSVNSAANDLNTLESKMWSANDNFIHNAVDLDLDESQSEYIQANREWLAAENSYLNQKSVVSQKQSSQAQSWYSYQLYQSTITAPIDGTIVGLNLVPGLTISYTESNSGSAASQTVARIQTEGNPVALFYATEVDIPLIEVGQAVSIELDSVAEQTFPGTVTAVDRVGTVTSNVTQYQVLITFNESHEAILPNMSAVADLILEQKDNALVVPAAAVKEGRIGDNMVRVMVDGKPQPASVELGMETDTHVEILSGIEAGAEVVTGTSTGSADDAASGNKPAGMSGFGGGMGGGPGMRMPR